MRSEGTPSLASAVLTGAGLASATGLLSLFAAVLTAAEGLSAVLSPVLAATLAGSAGLALVFALVWPGVATGLLSTLAAVATVLTETPRSGVGLMSIRATGPLASDLLPGLPSGAGL